MRYVLIALTPMLTTTALYRSSLAWFEACSWKPTPKGLPSSHMQLRAQFVRSFSTFLFCAPAAHFPSHSVPAQLFDGRFRGKDGQIGEEFPVNAGPVGRLLAFPGMQDGQGQRRIALLLSDRWQDAQAAV